MRARSFAVAWQRIPVLASSAAVLSACEPADGSRRVAATIVRDTVGDTIVVRNTGAGSWGDSVRLVEELRIGDADGGEQYGFAFVIGIVADRAGTITVADLRMRSVRQYDSTGRYLRHVGGEGAGPGEHRSPESLALLPDGRLLLRDVGNGRINVYTTDGRPLGALALPSGLTGAMRSLFVDTADRINALVTTRGSRGQLRTGYLRMDTTGRILDTLHTPVWSAEVPNPAPYEVGESWNPLPSGGFVGGINDRYAFHVLRPGDAPLRIERTDAPPLPVADAERTELDARRHDALQRSRERHLARPFRPIPSTKPAYRYVRVGADGRFWVRPHLPSLERDVPAIPLPIAERPLRWYELQAWDVFEPDGTYLGRVPFPTRATMHLVHGLRVWGVDRDSLDVPYLVRWRIEPTR